MSRPYINLGIEQLEGEFERALEEDDETAIGLLQAELNIRRQSPRVRRLTKLIADRGASQTVETKTEPDFAFGSTMLGSSRAGSSRGSQRGDHGKQNRAPTFTPTSEQEVVVDLFRTGENLKINAYAGAGKTSTLELVSHATRARGLYLAFNRRIVQDAREKFPGQVQCATTHSMAYRSLIGTYGQPKMTSYLNANQLAEVLQLKNWRIDRHHALAPRSQAFLILATIRRYCQSASPVIASQHVPRHGSLVAAPEGVLKAVTDMAMGGGRSRLGSHDRSL
jgi:hypothetical protein